jgi:HSP20 family protein
MPVSRDAGRQAGQRGTAVAGPQSFLPSLLAAPPGLFASAFMSNPYGFMQRMSEEMDRLFQTAGFGGSLPAPLTSGSAAAGRGLATGREGGMWTPQIEVRQRGNELVVRADLPGIKKEDVNVEVNDGMLTISGERRQEDTEEREGFYRSERSYGTFYRSIPLPEGVTEDQISASFEDGVLEVVVPTPQQQQPRGRKVQIK